MTFMRVVQEGQPHMTPSTGQTKRPVPTVALAVSAPDCAASKDVYGGCVCGLSYGLGTVDYQTLDVTLGITSSSTVIPKEANFVWTVTLSDYGSGAHNAPTTKYSANNRWSLTLNPTGGNAAPTFTAAITVLADGVAASELACQAKLQWTSLHTIYPTTTVNNVASASLESAHDGKSDTSTTYPGGTCVNTQTLGGEQTTGVVPARNIP